VVLGNLASANATGCVIGGSGGTVARSKLAVANTGSGFVLGGDGQRGDGNVATGNAGFGFIATNYSAATLAGNVAVGNLQGVFAGGGDQLTVSGLAAIGNLEGGVHNQGTTAMTLTASNLVGNGSKGLGANLNCGTLNENESFVASNVFWGAATGPGDDPADDVCELGNVVTTVESNAVKPFKVKTKVPVF
jgi:hypothetical protein